MQDARCQLFFCTILATVPTSNSFASTWKGTVFRSWLAHKYLLILYQKKSNKLTSETGISGPLFVIVEFAPHGNLRQFLRERRPSEYQHSRQSYSGPSLTIRDFVSFAFQIARGMEYLGTRKVRYIGSHSLAKWEHGSIYAKAIRL